MIRNPLLDRDFLRSLDQEKEREIYARVISLNFEEEPIEEITGRVTTGSINIDGKSAVRRTCSLTLVAEEMNIHDYYWGMNTKFYLEIGMKNNINKNYDDIIWFPQGLFLISTFNTSQSINNYTISLQGRDKMVLLNGEVGGMITALTHDFGTVDVQQQDGSYVNEKIPIKNIIRSAVQTFAGEPAQNIIINDVDDYGVELMEYRGEEPMYLLVDRLTDEVVNPRFGKKKNADGEYKEWHSRQYMFKHYDVTTGSYPNDWVKNQDNTYKYISIDENMRPDKITDIIYDNRIDYLDVPNNPTILGVYVGNSIQEYYVIKAEYGTTVGYRMTDLTYPGDLIIQVGGTITNMLDKLVSMLGEFEYFYDLDGHFVFQRKKTFLQTSWNNIVENEDSETYVDNLTESSAITYNFENATLVTAFANNPDLKNLKNDFSIWGARKSATGAEIPIHLRYAIDKKPQYYVSLDGITYTTRTEEEVEWDKKNFETDLGNSGYQKEPSRFGLSEDWWEVRDWAKAWEFSGLGVPTEWLGKYCPIRAVVYKEGERPASISSGYEEVPISAETWESWGTYLGNRACNTDDLIFNADGTIKTYHGGCAHSYTWWLESFDSGGIYEGGFAYFYKPQVPADELGEGGQGLILGDQIVYNLDWRELIYQMALDYMDRGDEDDFLIRLREKNASFYPTGITGYEQYYTDILGFWRELYNPDYTHTFTREEVTATKFKSMPTGYYWTPKQCPAGLAYDTIYQFAIKNDHKDFRFTNFTKQSWDRVVDKTQYYYLVQATNYQFDAVYYIEISDEYMKDDVNKNYWSKTALKSPELLNFWFDFLDTTDGTLERCSVHNVGDRPKAENDNDVKAIYYRDTPNIIVINPITLKKEERAKLIKAYKTEDKWEKAIIAEYGADVDLKFQKDTMVNTMMDMRIAEIKALNPGYTLIRLNSASENMFTISAQGKSAFDALNTYVYNHAHCAETITITSLPVYYLEPNTRISVKDDNSGINGEYIINKITLPLQHSGTMSISATKAVERLF